MVWIAPRTWVAGEIVTAAQMNNQIRSNLKAIGDPWIAYTPAWTATTTNPAIGNGTLAAAYMQAGQLVNFRIGITMGSTTTYGSGQWRLSLPVPPVVFRWSAYGDASIGTAAYPIRGVYITSAAALALLTPGTTAGGADRSTSATAPATWASGDTLFLSGTYEAA